MPPSTFPLAIYLGSLVAFLGLFWLGARRWQRPTKRSPLSKGLLRSPGESLRKQIDDASDGITLSIVAPTGGPLLLYASYQAQLLSGARLSLFWEIVHVVIAVVIVIYFAFKAVRMMQKRRRLVLGYEAELAIGQELNQLLRGQYWVFHDVPFDRFNIDHIVVGRTGVFAVETKGRAKPIGKDGKAKWEVTYDGKRLQFPGWAETAPLEQSQRQANALQKWLTRAVGESVSVSPVLALPGWYVKRSARGPVAVINGSNPGAYFRKAGNANLSDQMITRIVHQLDQTCRDVEPKAYGKARQKQPA